MNDHVDLARVIELDQDATPGPWFTAEPMRGFTPGGVFWEPPDGEVEKVASSDWCEPDAELIAFYRGAAPAMARALLELREKALSTQLSSVFRDYQRFVEDVLRVTGD